MIYPIFIIGFWIYHWGFDRLEVRLFSNTWTCTMDYASKIVKKGCGPILP